jgi:hypothetical protein
VSNGLWGFRETWGEAGRVPALGGGIACGGGGRPHALAHALRVAAKPLVVASPPLLPPPLPPGRASRR